MSTTGQVKVSIRARNIVRFAKKNNINMTTYCSSNHCAVAVLGKMVGIEYTGGDRSSRDIAVASGRSHKDIVALEAGFERWYHSEENSNRYYKVGKKIADMVGYKV